MITTHQEVRSIFDSLRSRTAKYERHGQLDQVTTPAHVYGQVIDAIVRAFSLTEPEHGRAYAADRQGMADLRDRLLSLSIHGGIDRDYLKVALLQSIGWVDEQLERVRPRTPPDLLIHAGSSDDQLTFDDGNRGGVTP